MDQTFGFPSPIKSRKEKPMAISMVIWLTFRMQSLSGMLKKAASGVLAILPCSRTKSTLRASKWLRPCWTDFFEHSPSLMSVAVLKHLWPMNMKYSTDPLSKEFPHLSTVKSLPTTRHASLTRFVGKTHPTHGFYESMVDFKTEVL